MDFFLSTGMSPIKDVKRVGKLELREAFLSDIWCLLRRQNHIVRKLHFNVRACVGAHMLPASVVESFEYVITGPRLIAFQNDLSRVVCWFNFSHVIRLLVDSIDRGCVCRIRRRIPSWLHPMRPKHDETGIVDRQVD